MKSSAKLIVANLSILFVMANCIHSPENSFIPPLHVCAGDLVVDTGYTTGSGDFYPNATVGEYSAFTLRWNNVEDAVFYEIKASTEPITTSNWNDAIPMKIVPAPAESAYVFNTVEVQPEPCIACGLCQQMCPMDAISVQGGVAVINGSRCTSCGMCMQGCPVNAITGTRNGENYYFGIRAFFDQYEPAEEIWISDDAYRIILFNSRSGLWGPQIKSCGVCPDQFDSIGVYAGCHAINEYSTADRNIFTGYGCPYDALWQDTMGIGPVGNMVYIDYEKCLSCGVCFTECWNYNLLYAPSYVSSTGGYCGMRSIMHKVVPSGWMSPQPQNPN